ncbi:WD repeat-containing protein 82-B-like [Sitodiplosis mosellana]|uniref:WD repeat-containing protein 82-B-like n=1 Tax=Sitodiplosis mosellana TaxID=263140 RepID=UPI002444AB9D|nr:WD repeat-containing protein 82-B-like [Sitodiplosis mosellana]
MTVETNARIEHAESDNLMRSFNIFPNFRKPVNNTDVRIRSIKFSPDGQKCVAANNERTIELYDCNTARFERHYQLFKHGISTMEYMDASDKIVVGSNVRGDFGIRELNLTTNQYAATYIGHEQPSYSLSVNAANKLILSGGCDKSIMLFDFRTPNAQVARHNLSATHNPLVALHPWTDLCAVGLDDSRIEIYDLRGIPYGPFAVFKLNNDNVRWTSFKFSANAKQFLIGTNSPKIRVVNSKTGVIQQVFGSRRNTLDIPIAASYTPNDEYILSGSSDGNVLVFSNNKKNTERDMMGYEREQKVAELHSYQPEAITAVEMNPIYSLIASASSYVAFWTPTIEN